MKRSYRLFTSSAEATLLIGYSMGQLLQKGSVIALMGDLGAGKTQLVKGFIHGSLNVATEHVVSPTFCYLNSYTQGRIVVHHFDLYRIHHAQTFTDMGFADYLIDSESICCIEWPEIIFSLLPTSTIKIQMMHQGDELRKIDIEIGCDSVLSPLHHFLKEAEKRSLSLD